MFGYKLFKKVEIEKLKSNLLEVKTLVDKQEKEIIELFDRLKEVEKLKSNLVDVKTIVDRHENHIVELFGKNKEQDNITVVNLTENTKVNNEHVEEKPIKKIRRKNTKKNTKNEE